MVKIGESKLSKGYLTTVPKAVREALDLEVGSRLEWHIENQKVVLKKAKAE